MGHVMCGDLVRPTTPVCLHHNTSTKLRRQAEAKCSMSDVRESCFYLTATSYPVSAITGLETLSSARGFETSSQMPRAKLYLPSNYKAEVAHLTAAMHLLTNLSLSPFLIPPNALTEASSASTADRGHAAFVITHLALVINSPCH